MKKTSSLKIIKSVTILFRCFKSKIFIGIVIGAALILLANLALHYSSTDPFCDICHVHPNATMTWKQGAHFDNSQGIFVHCVECHLPPASTASYLPQKARLGLRDAYSKLFKDPSKINWEVKSGLDHAVTHTFESSCIRCHQNLFPRGLSKKGTDAHLYYTQKPDQLNCLNCHLHVGHYSKESKTQGLETGESKSAAIYSKPAVVTAFTNFTEFIPGSSVRFDMIAVPAGTFTLGSPEDEPYRGADEGPAKKVRISQFWMGKAEVSWDEFEAWYRQNVTEGRTTDRRPSPSADDLKVDAMTGPTPPYGNPDQGWGKGSHPAITMTYYAAQKYCDWLSRVTGKIYRLPTEAEWEYACRAGTQTPYFFRGDPGKFTAKKWWNRVFGADTTEINSYAIYAMSSGNKTCTPDRVRPNPFGLLHMAGNVKEFCSDWYSADVYSNYKDSIEDPTGPQSGTEHVIRGGSYQSDAAELRSAARDHTRQEQWMVTDPQIPKSLWWYSDCKDVGFRVVCEYR
jgi:sulfatase modifying factor 1